jgi:glc operon protein GlcG
MEKFYLNSRKLTLHAAKILADAARDEAKKHGVPGALAIVDDGANLMYLERWDNTMIAASKIAINKAITAVGFGRPTKKIEDVILQGRTPMLALTGTVEYAPLMGGYPVVVDNIIIGGIAAAGTLSAEMDEVIVKTALAVFEKQLMGEEPLRYE